MTVLVGVQEPDVSPAAIRAAAVRAGLLVVSSRADGALSWLLGSQYVLRNAPCPILIGPDSQPGPSRPGPLVSPPLGG